LKLQTRLTVSVMLLLKEDLERLEQSLSSVVADFGRKRHLCPPYQPDVPLFSPDPLSKGRTVVEGDELGQGNLIRRDNVNDMRRSGGGKK